MQTGRQGHIPAVERERIYLKGCFLQELFGGKGEGNVILTLYEPFRHWSETGSVYILSDPHFGDPHCKLMNPDWIEPEEQVDRINALVMKNDTFVCLGDVGDASFVKQIFPIFSHFKSYNSFLLDFYA